MQESKYFTPNIEDIHVGYECQCFNIETGQWADYTIDSNEDLFDFMDDMSLEYHLSEDNIRVPYLTAEQIVKAGWIHIYDDFTFGKFIKLGPVGYEMFYDYNDHSMDIDDVDLQDVHIDLFQGTCKDINTFKKIFKLIKNDPNRNKRD
jgi:hypothetical protein